MNQIINMIIKILMRKTISKGIDAGFSAASRPRKRQAQPVVDDYGNVTAPQQAPDDQPHMTPEEKRAMRQRRQAKRAARQARQAAKVSGRATRL